MTTSSEMYDEDYFERGPESGKSLYEAYRWLPWRMARAAKAIVDAFGLKPGDTVLDVGCAKGFLVRALRFFDIEADGVDVSRYALSHADPNVAAYLFEAEGFWRTMDEHEPAPYDLAICKDVLEHLTCGEIADLLRNTAKVARRLFAVIPLGDGERFTVPQYNADVTHITPRPVRWWRDRLEAHGWRITRVAFKFPAFKESWTERYPLANGFLSATAQRSPVV